MKQRKSLKEASKYNDLQHQERTKQFGQIKINWCSSTVCIMKVINAVIIFMRLNKKVCLYLRETIKMLFVD